MGSLCALPGDWRLAGPGVRVVGGRCQESPVERVLTSRRFAPDPGSWTEGRRPRPTDGTNSESYFHLRPGELRQIWLEQDSAIRAPAEALVLLRLRHLQPCAGPSSRAPDWC